MNHAHTHTYAWRSKRFDTYKHNNAINEFFYASHNQICLYGNVWGRCACCFLQPLPSKRTHAHMHTPIKIPTCCSVLFGEAAKRDDVLTVLLHHRAHTHAHTVCFCLSQPNKPMHKSIQFDYFNAVYILLTNQTFLSYDNFLIQSSKHTQMQLYECVAPPAPHPRSRVQYVLTSLFPDIPLTYTFNTIFAISYVSFRI